jgi:hypothetical protein
MGVPTSEVGYTSATAGRGSHEVRKGHLVLLDENRYRRRLYYIYTWGESFEKEGMCKSTDICRWDDTIAIGTEFLWNRTGGLEVLENVLFDIVLNKLKNLNRYSANVENMARF